MLLFLMEKLGDSPGPRTSADLGSVFTPCNEGIPKLGAALAQMGIHGTAWEFGCHGMLQ